MVNKKQSPNLAMRISQEDKAMLEELARRLERSQTATVRLLVRGALDVLLDREVKRSKSKTKA